VGPICVSDTFHLDRWGQGVDLHRPTNALSQAPAGVTPEDADMLDIADPHLDGGVIPGTPVPLS
jgi:hypothetical protein